MPTEAELARAEGRDYEPADVLLKRILAERRAKWEADELAKMIAKGKPPKDDRWKAKYKEPAAARHERLAGIAGGVGWAASIGQVAECLDYMRVPSDTRRNERHELVRFHDYGANGQVGCDRRTSFR